MILEPHNLAEKDLSVHGLTDLGEVFWNLTPAQLVEHALKRGEGVLAKDGPLIVHTGEYTGRSPKDKYIVQEPSSEHNIWWGDVNQPVSQSDYQTLYKAMIAYAKGKDLYVFEGYAGADDTYQMPVRIITEFAWHSQFAGNMFIQAESTEDLEDHNPEFTVIDMPGCKAPAGLGLNSDTFIVVNFAQKVVLIGGTEYAGEIKKSIFSALNYTLPLDGVMAMHCSANYGKTKDDAALFFGLSGTGKTTLSNDPHRPLIGDDEHGWSDAGVFNFEVEATPKSSTLTQKASRRFLRRQKSLAPSSKTLFTTQTAARLITPTITTPKTHVLFIR